MAVELRFEVEATSGVSIVVKLNPLFSWALLSEEGKWNLSVANVVTLVNVSVVNMDLEVVADETSVNLHVLVLPSWVLSTVVSDV